MKMRLLVPRKPSELPALEVVANNEATELFILSFLSHKDLPSGVLEIKPLFSITSSMT
jgi:hypothetical protein